MTRTQRIVWALLTAFLALMSGSGVVAAQQPGQMLARGLVGTWTLMAVTNHRTDGTQVAAYGPTPAGIATFDSAGRFSQILMRPDLPKIASNNRLTATPDEIKAISNGSLAFFGTYAVQSDETLTLRVLGSTFPNWTGTDQQRTASVNGDELTITSTTTDVGGKTVIVWRRAH